MHPIEGLFARMSSVEPYPQRVVPVPARIPGVAFFPGGAGLWRASSGCPLPDMPIGGVMVLGHDFHSKTGFHESLAQGSEVPDVATNGYRTPATWVNLRAFLKDADIPLERCFFTNAYMGLRMGVGKTGRFPGSRDPRFISRCRAFLIDQISVQRPRVILTLGTWVPGFVAPSAPKLKAWARARSVAAIDAAGGVHHDVWLTELPEFSCSVVALTHPSLRGPNVHRRQFGELRGHEAELAMISEAMRESRLATGPTVLAK
jgi:hypothetical protein